MLKTIIVKTTFNGEHFWADAPEEVKFLRITHPHTFFVEAEIEVKHDDRELEFFIVKRQIDDFCSHSLIEVLNRSCENIAELIIGKLKKLYGSDRYLSVTIYEDNVNGGRVVSDMYET